MMQSNKPKKYNYCPLCGGPLWKDRTKKSTWRCQRCEISIFPNKKNKRFYSGVKKTAFTIDNKKINLWLKSETPLKLMDI